MYLSKSYICSVTVVETSRFVVLFDEMQWPYHYRPTLDLAVLWTPSSDTSRPICSDSLNR